MMGEQVYILARNVVDDDPVDSNWDEIMSVHKSLELAIHEAESFGYEMREKFPDAECGCAVWESKYKYSDGYEMLSWLSIYRFELKD